MVSTGYSGRATKQAEWNRAGLLLWVKHAERGTSRIAATAWTRLYSCYYAFLNPRNRSAHSAD
jgi:hypothetical protein